MTRHSLPLTRRTGFAALAAVFCSPTGKNAFGACSARLILGLCIFLAAISTSHAQAYRGDIGFNGGGYYLDAFSGSATQSYRAKKLVRLDSGDVVVAGLVPHLQGGNSGGVGLVRYNAAGQRVAWANPGTAGYSGNQYVVYDPNIFVPHPTDDVKAIFAYGNLLFVLVDSEKYILHTGGGNPPQIITVFSGYSADVLVFNSDGQFLGSTEMGSNDAASTDPRNFFGGGIGVYANSLLTSNSTVSLVFGGTSIESGVLRPLFQRFTVNSDGTLTAPTGLMHPNPGNYCPTNRGCEITGVALGGRPALTSPPRIYLGGSRQTTLNSTDWDYMAMNVFSDGSANTGFNTNGVNVLGFNIVAGGNDRGQDIAVIGVNGATSNDQIYVGGNVPVNCGDGMGVVKFSGNGSVDLSFGPGNLGKRYFADVYSAQSICILPRTDNYAHAMVLSNGKIAMVGQRNTGPIFAGGEGTVDATLAVLRADNGDLDSFDDYPFSDIPGGTRSRHSGLWGVVPVGDGTFTATGDVRYPSSADASLAGKMQYATIRFSERIFKSTLGYGDDPVTP